MLPRSITAAAAYIGCTLLFCETAGAQQLDEFVTTARASIGAFVKKSLLAISDEVIVNTIGRAQERDRVLRALFDPNLDPTSTPAWSKIVTWDNGRFLSSESILGLWRSKKTLIVGALAKLETPERDQLAARLAGVRRALDDYRMDRQGIRVAFREQRDAYALCQGKHGANTQTLKDTTYRLVQRANELGDGLGELAFADRLWNAGGYQLLSVALTVGAELDEELNRAHPILQSALPESRAELTGTSGLQ